LFVITFITAMLAALVLYVRVVDDPRYIASVPEPTTACPQERFWN
jgi:hypothetical protein